MFVLLHSLVHFLRVLLEVLHQLYFSKGGHTQASSASCSPHTILNTVLIEVSLCSLFLNLDRALKLLIPMDKEVKVYDL